MGKKLFCMCSIMAIVVGIQGCDSDSVSETDWCSANNHNVETLKNYKGGVQKTTANTNGVCASTTPVCVRTDANGKATDDATQWFCSECGIFGEMMCNNKCTNVLANSEYCGDCDTKCTDGKKCRNGLCVLKDNGDSCDEDKECESGICSASKCASERVQGDVGSKCDKPDDCKTGVCEKNRCALKNVGDDCEDKSECKTNKCKSRRCSLLDLNDSCENADECESGFCNVVCKLRPVNASCTDKSQCETDKCSGSESMPGNCQYKLNGEICGNGNQCSSKRCDGGICANVPIIEVDPTFVRIPTGDSKTSAISFKKDGALAATQIAVESSDTNCFTVIPTTINTNSTSPSTLTIVANEVENSCSGKVTLSENTGSVPATIDVFVSMNLNGNCNNKNDCSDGLICFEDKKCHRSISLKASEDNINLAVAEEKTLTVKYILDNIPNSVADKTLVASSKDTKCVSIDETATTTASGAEFKVKAVNTKDCSTTITISDPTGKAEDIVVNASVGVADKNGNHMLDEHEDLSDNNKTCKIDSDCNSGFCDSALGYKCSTKCTEKEQCVDGYVCRSDGRCTVEDFETVWKPYYSSSETCSGSSNYKQYAVVYLPSLNGTCNQIKIDWGDGNITSPTNCNSTSSNAYTEHRYESLCIKDEGYQPLPTAFHIKIHGDSGALKGWYLANSSYKTYLLEVVSFGMMPVNGDFFKGAAGLTKVSDVDIPNSVELKSTVSMFEQASEFNGNISKWDVSNVQDMSSMFKYARKFDQPLNGWNTKNVHSMKEMFLGASVFNSDIDLWNTANVNDMSGMFREAAAFNRDINTSGDSWNTGRVTDMSYMFYNSAFNGYIDKWDTSKVTSMQYMFGGTSKFQQDISNWSFVSIKNIHTSGYSNGVYQMFEDYCYNYYCKLKQNDSWKVCNTNNPEQYCYKTDTNYCRNAYPDVNNIYYSSSACSVSCTQPAKACNAQ